MSGSCDALGLFSCASKCDGGIDDARVYSFGLSEIGAPANTCCSPTSCSLESNIGSPESCLPVDTPMLTRSNSSESTLGVGLTSGLVRAIESPRSGPFDYAFGSPATCVSVSMAALPTLTAFLIMCAFRRGHIFPQLLMGVLVQGIFVETT